MTYTPFYPKRSVKELEKLGRETKDVATDTSDLGIRVTQPSFFEKLFSAPTDQTAHPSHSPYECGKAKCFYNNEEASLRRSIHIEDLPTDPSTTSSQDMYTEALSSQSEPDECTSLYELPFTKCDNIPFGKTEKSILEQSTNQKHSTLQNANNFEQIEQIHTKELTSPPEPITKTLYPLSEMKIKTSPEIFASPATTQPISLSQNIEILEIEKKHTEERAAVHLHNFITRIIIKFASPFKNLCCKRRRR